MNPQEVLKGLGLDAKEVAIYLGLLETGEASVLEISKKTGVKRPTAYLVLSALEGKGFVSRIVRGKKISFAAQHPKKILAEAEIRLKEIKDVIPQFEAMLARSDTRPRVMIFEGKDALDRAYDDAFLFKGEVLFMSNISLVLDIFQRTLTKLDYATSHEFRTREIMIESDDARAYAKRTSKPYRHIRFMPPAFAPFDTDIGIFGNTTIITSGKKEYFSIKIQSEEIAGAFRAMFEAMWQVSRDAEDSASIGK